MFTLCNITRATNWLLMLFQFIIKLASSPQNQSKDILENSGVFHLFFNFLFWRKEWQGKGCLDIITTLNSVVVPAKTQ